MFYIYYRFLLCHRWRVGRQGKGDKGDKGDKGRENYLTSLFPIPNPQSPIPNPRSPIPDPQQSTT
ncbi:hypothetical protein B4U84_01210 [Westiellopsis prolifica IICB1]|nr:hypothetical protein B4U84_01210 [Westiellopsis prolifica IICB1]